MRWTTKEAFQSEYRLSTLITFEHCLLRCFFASESYQVNTAEQCRCYILLFDSSFTFCFPLFCNRKISILPILQVFLFFSLCFFFSFWSHFLLHGINFFDVYCCTEVFLVAVVTRTCYEGGWGGGKGKSGKWEPEEGMRRTEEDKTEQLKKTLPVGLWAQESSSGVDE